jgi:uncharacterized protein involved in exopolysaccharide biosynthesis
MEEQEKTLQDYMAILSRRKLPMLITMVAVFLIGVVVALVWPPTFRSSATILIKEQEVPVDLVRSTVTSYAAERIKVIEQSVLTRSNLTQIIEKYNLYEKERKRKTMEEVLQDMRDDIKLDMIEANVVDPRSGRSMSATIAFMLSYDGRSPDSTQRVAGELTSLFLAENLKNRTEKANETYTFLTEESNKLAQQIAEMERSLAEFKEKHADSLPELSALNFSTIDRTEMELDQADSELRALDERRYFIESQLAQTNPLAMMQSATGERILDPSSRLKALEAEYASLSVKYSAEHPDVMKVKREIEGLRESTGLVSNTIEIAGQLSNARTELGMAEQAYSADHPDVVRLKKVVAELEGKLKAAERLPEQKAATQRPDNPAYIQLQTQLESVKSDMNAVRERKQKLRGKVAEYELRVSRSPQVERDYQAMLREHENASRRYQDIRARQMEAEIGQALEKESKGESFQLIDPAQFPEEPIKPNRILITLLSLVFAMACGFGYALVAESLDSSIRGVKSVTAMLVAAPLAVIPAIYTPVDYYRRKRFNKIAVTVTVASFVLVILAVHIFWQPLDVLWFRSVRKAENIIGM